MGFRSKRGRVNYRGCPPHWKALWDFTLVYAKTAEPIEMSFRGLTYVGSTNHLWYEDHGRTNPFATTNTAMRPFVEILWLLVSCAIFIFADNRRCQFSIILHFAPQCPEIFFLYCFAERSVPSDLYVRSKDRNLTVRG